MKSITKKLTLAALVVVSFVGYAYETYLKPTSTSATTSPGSVADTTGGTSQTSAPSETTNPNAGGTATGGTTNGTTNTGNTGSTSSGAYKDGTYTGTVADAYFGNVQVAVNISGGKISNVTFLQYPNDRGTSRQINADAIPKLTAEAVAMQSAKVDIVSGATQSSEAFQQSLQSALIQAKV